MQHSKPLHLTTLCATFLMSAIALIAKSSAEIASSSADKAPIGQAPIGQAPLSKAPAAPKTVSKATERVFNGNIPIRFSLEKPSYVTLVIEHAKTGERVRNLIAETQLPAGKNLVLWDGYNDGTRDEKNNLVTRCIA